MYAIAFAWPGCDTQRDENDGSATRCASSLAGSICVRISEIVFGLGEGLGRGEGVGASVVVDVAATVGVALAAVGPAEAPPHATRSADAATARNRRIFTSL